MQIVTWTWVQPTVKTWNVSKTWIYHCQKPYRITVVFASF